MNKIKDTLRVFVVPTEILDAELDIYEKMVYMVLRSYANGQDDTAFPSYQTIANKGSMGRKKAIECVKKLVELGLVIKEERKKVSKGNGISQTSNLYTIYRPADVKKKEVVSDKHHPSVPQTPPLVSDKHHPSVPQTPENNYLKELDLKEEEEEEVSPHSDLVSFLLSKDITIENAQKFESRLLEEGLTGYTNEQVIEAIEWSLYQFIEGKCDEPYIYAVGRLTRVLDNKVKKVTNKPKQQKKVTGSTRKEMLPDWFDETKQTTPATQDASKKAKRNEIERMLQQLRG